MNEHAPNTVDFIAEIGTASGPKALLEAYVAGLEKNPRIAEELQRATGKRLLELGDTAAGVQFILLADQTANQNAATEAVRMSAEIAHRNAETSGRMIDASIRINHATDKFENDINLIGRKVSALAQDLSPLTNVARGISEAAQTIHRATGGMTEAAHTMDSASRRMRG